MARIRRAVWIVACLCLLATAGFCQGGDPAAPLVSPSKKAPVSPDWIYVYQDGIEQSKKESKPVLLDFYADWCNPCRMMDARVYTDPRVVKALQEFVCIKVDVVREEKLAFAYRIQSIPRTIVLNIFQESIGDRIGFLDSEEFIEFLDSTKAYALKKVDGLVASVPTTSVVAPAQPLVVVTAKTELSSLTDLLAGSDQAARDEAVRELVNRNTPETRRGLIEALEDDYLGTRIAAWKAVRIMHTDLDPQFDPWALRSEREAALHQIRQLFKNRAESGSE